MMENIIIILLQWRPWTNDELFTFWHIGWPGQHEAAKVTEKCVKNLIEWEIQLDGDLENSDDWEQEKDNNPVRKPPNNDQVKDENPR